MGCVHRHTEVTAGVASTAVLPALTTRQYLRIENKHATDAVWVRTDGAPATVGTGVRILAGTHAEWTFGAVPIGAITAIRGAAADIDLAVTEGI